MKKTAIAAMVAFVLVCNHGLTQEKADGSRVLPGKTIRTDLNVADFVDQSSASEIMEERNSIIDKMQKERLDIIRNDAKARELYTKILELHRQLAIVVDSKPSMKSMIRDLKNVDNKLSGLPKKTNSEPQK